MPETMKARPGANMRLIEALQYRLPIAGVVSILHRGSGMLMFFLLPFVIWLFDKSVTSEISYDTFASASTPLPFMLGARTSKVAELPHSMRTKSTKRSLISGGRPEG